jgi:hypothetical protein
MNNVIRTLLVLSILAGCDAKQKVSLLCDDNKAYGYTSEGNLGPWLMTSSGPMIGDSAGKVTGQPIQCADAKKLFNVESVVEMRTIQVDKCHPESEQKCVGIDLEALQKQPAPASADNCVTSGPNSPIVVGQNSVVVIDGKTYKQGQSSDCPPASGELETQGVNSPIVTGAGAQVTITTD